MFIVEKTVPSDLSFSVQEEDSVKYNLTEVKRTVEKSNDEYIPIGYGFATYCGKPCFDNVYSALKYCWGDSKCVEITTSKLNGDIFTYIRPARSEFYEKLQELENVDTTVVLNKDGEVLINGWSASKPEIRNLINRLIDLL